MQINTTKSALIKISTAAVLLATSLTALACACCGPDSSAYSVLVGVNDYYSDIMQDPRMSIRGGMGEKGDAGSGNFMENPTMVAKWDAPAANAVKNSVRTMSVRLSQKDVQGQWQGLNLQFTPKPFAQWTYIFRTEPNTSKKVNPAFGYAPAYTGHHDFVVPGTLRVISDPNKYWASYGKLEAQFVFKGTGSHCFGEGMLQQFHARFTMHDADAKGGSNFLNGSGSLK